MCFLLWVLSVWSRLVRISHHYALLNRPLYLSSRMETSLRSVNPNSYIPFGYLLCREHLQVHTFLFQLPQFCHSFLELFLKEKLGE